MKLNNLLPLLTAVILLACNTAQKAQNTTNAVPGAKPSFVTWDKKMIDLGKVKKGEKREMFFEFTNTSGQDIQIDIVDACACTTVDFPRGVIAPKGTGRLSAVFDSTEKEAGETIGITIVFKNTDEQGYPKIESIEYKFELIP
jgi:peptidoglycan-associated lipoprotein